MDMKSLFFIFLCLLSFVWTADAAELVLFVTSDLHGRAQRLAALASAIREPEDAIRIDCGDTMPGTLFSVSSGGRVMADLMRSMHYDVWVPGNHDFELPQKNFSGLASIAAGGDWRGDAMPPHPAYRLLRRGHWKIGVLTLTDPRMNARIVPGGPWRFAADWRAELRSQTEALMRERPHVVILAAHAGLHTPPNGGFYRLIADFPEIDLVLGAHSHEEHPGEKIGRRTFFVQPGKHGECVARISLFLDDRTRRLTRITSRLIRSEGLLPTPEAEAVLCRYRGVYEREAGEVLTKCSPPLRLPREKEFDYALGKIGAEAVRRAGKTDYGIFSSSAQELTAPEQLTREALFSLIPYENMLYRAELSRADFRMYLEEEIRRSRKGRHVVAVAGNGVLIDRLGRIRRFETPERVTITLNAYLFTRGALCGKAEKILPLDRMERDAVAEYLKDRTSAAL